jgi:hypothetical protein
MDPMYPQGIPLLSDSQGEFSPSYLEIEGSVEQASALSKNKRQCWKALPFFNTK